MLIQIYEISSPQEARALAELGVDHIGVLVGDGSFPREQSIDHARLIFSAIPSSSKGSALSLSADVRLIEHIVSSLKPAILQPRRVYRPAHFVSRATAQGATWCSYLDAQHSG
jgi:phosphoribosylanthranilate isomerase